MAARRCITRRMSERPKSEPSIATLERYAALFDFARKPTTRAGWVVRGVVTLLAVAFLVRTFERQVGPMLKASPPAPITSSDDPENRYGLTAPVRHQIFTELATAELAERKRAIEANSWKGHLWSREDDRGHNERVTARAVAGRHRVSLTQVYLVLDEGIREHWLAPNDSPLSALTPPLSLRTEAW